MLATGIARPAPVDAANGSNVKVGRTNTGTSATKIFNTASAAGAKAII
jgi:hypothetical protein